MNLNHLFDVRLAETDLMICETDSKGRDNPQLQRIMQVIMKDDAWRKKLKGDGVTDNTIIIQKAVDECSKKGGGTVLIPSGSYLIRPIELKSNVNLHLDFGTLLLGSTRLSDYDNAFPFKDGSMNQSSGLLFARGQKNISITGFGTIDGQGGSKTFQFGNDADGGPKRPKIIYFVDVQTKVRKTDSYYHP